MISQIETQRALVRLRKDLGLEVDENLADEESCSYMIDVLTSGAPTLMSWLREIEQEPLCEEREKLVWEILSMFEELYRSKSELPDEEAAGIDIPFSGFDANTEGLEREFARLDQVRKGGPKRCWADLGDLSNLNSHFGHINGMYSRMLAVFKRIKGDDWQNRLTKVEIQQVIDAGKTGTG